MDSYKVMVPFEHHDGETLTVYGRGRIISPREARKFRNWSNLVSAGFVVPAPGTTPSRREIDG